MQYVQGNGVLVWFLLHGRRSCGRWRSRFGRLRRGRRRWLRLSLAQARQMSTEVARWNRVHDLHCVGWRRLIAGKQARQNHQHEIEDSGMGKRRDDDRQNVAPSRRPFAASSILCRFHPIKTPGCLILDQPRRCSAALGHLRHHPHIVDSRRLNRPHHLDYVAVWDLFIGADKYFTIGTLARDCS